MKKKVKWVATLLAATMLAACGNSLDKEDARNYVDTGIEDEAEKETTSAPKKTQQDETTANDTEQTTTTSGQAETNTEAKTTAPTVSAYTQLSGAVYVATGRVDDGLNLRQGPGVKYSKVLSYEMPNGTMLQLEGKQGDWYKVSVEGSNVEGWVNGKFTSTTIPSYTEDHSKKIYVAIYGDTLALRTGPGVKYGKIGDLVYSEPLYVYRTSGQWSYVYAPSQEAYGWVNSSYTLSSLEATEDAPESAPLQTMTVNVQNDTLVLRSSASKDSTELDRLVNGTTVQVYEKQGAWYKVYVPSTGDWGWVHSGFLK